MAVRLTPPDAIRTLYAIQCVTKDLKPSQSSYCMNTQEMYKLGNFRSIVHGARKSPTDSIRCKSSGTGDRNQNPKERNNTSSDNALVHKVHPGDRPIRNNVQERAKCTELDDILAKWNVYKPRK
ncbi:uncharacterized protein LOC108622104 [Ceratina calcarata]|uniref:Uncharacterized protein LOC108622104 n=1 Tax=Ceratina calcarata TaxID=156304 RepID=A0AAJ7IS20_9HYME|nr:uncharacterized protein LOC108622104 [Ceratina calcarata]